METAVKEYRVWLETGDLLGLVCVYKRRAWWTVENEQPFYISERPKPKGFRSEQDAYDYAMGEAERYMSQAMEWEEAETERQGYAWDAEFSDSYHIQVTEAE